MLSHLLQRVGVGRHRSPLLGEGHVLCPQRGRGGARAHYEALFRMSVVTVNADFTL